MKTLLSVIGLALVASLAACTERPQEQGKRVVGEPAFKGATGFFVASDWKPGDQKSWEEHMRTRTTNGQDEYPRTSGK